MKLQLSELFAGKATRIKNEEYYPTSAYVEPFLERVNKLTQEIRINAVTPSQITYTGDGNFNTEDVTYNRVTIEAVLPETMKINDDDHKEVIGMVYGLDVRKPVVKFFHAAERCVCTNMCVFNPHMLACQDLKPKTAIDFKPLDRIIEQTSDIAANLKKLLSLEFKCDDYNINESLGKWVRNCINYSYDNHYGKVKVACSTPIDAYKALFEKKDSPYYYNGESSISMYDVYNAFTQMITDSRKKDFFNVFEKTLLIQDILGV